MAQGENANGTNSVVVNMVKDVEISVGEQIRQVKLDIQILKRDAQEEAEYSRSRNLLLLNWVRQPTENQPAVLENNVTAFINGHVLTKSDVKMTPDWIGKTHYMPGKKESPTVTVMVQFALAKQADLVWSHRLEMKSFNVQQAADKKAPIIIEKHHTKGYGKQLRYLNSVRLNMIKQRKINKNRVKVNGSRKDNPTLTYDQKVYTAFNITPEVYETVGPFGKPPPRPNHTSDPQAPREDEPTNGMELA